MLVIAGLILLSLPAIAPALISCWSISQRMCEPEPNGWWAVYIGGKFAPLQAILHPKLIWFWFNSGKTPCGYHCHGGWVRGWTLWLRESVSEALVLSWGVIRRPPGGVLMRMGCVRMGRGVSPTWPGPAESWRTRGRYTPRLRLAVSSTQ